jgi:hypothetical protein
LPNELFKSPQKELYDFSTAADRLSPLLYTFLTVFWLI